MAQIDIYIECHWELRTKEYTKKNVTGRKYVGKFRGGYEVVKCVGHPEINGGLATPDMMALFPTVKSIRDKFLNQYAARYPEDTVKVHIKKTKDDRNPTMDSYF